MTGSDGFIGRHLVPYLVRRGYRVIAASRLAATFEDPNIIGARLPDLSQPFDWEPLLKQCDVVIHLAGIAHKFAVDDLYDRINHQATAELCRAASRCGIKHLVLISSIAAQSGSFSTSELTEDDPPKPNNAYGRSKLAAERAVRASGVPFTILRPVVIYGAGEKGNFAIRPQDLAAADPAAVRRLDGATVRAVDREFQFSDRDRADQSARTQRDVHHIGSDAGHCRRSHRPLSQRSRQTIMAAADTREMA